MIGPLPSHGGKSRLAGLYAAALAAMGRQVAGMPTGNEAVRLRAHLGADTPEAFMKRPYRGPTPARQVKGRNGTKRAGAYGRGLRNWINARGHHRG